ncbi:hypothetical protein SLEP1_g30704 [Rubroshorea leprosula]|uniref:Uncharacterized protein n=1 Tax=Rubroshorea leprosula TaxID=152421 RepID=A0AAV5K0Z8_9ROSI|nr:hypothetical protein SLEP1_g30704 [Rubroshorea leprosula]
MIANPMTKGLLGSYGSNGNLWYIYIYVETKNLE